MTTELTLYAGIGSRRTPRNVLELMILIGQKAARAGATLRSGGAPGADQAFEQGCDEANGRKQIFIPWNGFEGRNARTEVGVMAGVHDQALELAAKFHPNWNACSPAAKKLHARNGYQLLGSSLDKPVDEVVCWTPAGRGEGGTGQAIRMARHFGIPVYDLGDAKVLDVFLQLLH